LYTFPVGPLNISSAPVSSGGGMLSQAGGKVAPPAPTATNTASRTIDAATATTGGGEKSWFEKLFTPERTMDLVMAGMKGYSEAAMREEDREYPEKIAKRNAKAWGRAYPGMLSMSQQYPSQQ
jgi:hypothetical protein